MPLARERAEKFGKIASKVLTALAMFGQGALGGLAASYGVRSWLEDDGSGERYTGELLAFLVIGIPSFLGKYFLINFFNQPTFINLAVKYLAPAEEQTRPTAAGGGDTNPDAAATPAPVPAPDTYTFKAFRKLLVLEQALVFAALTAIAMDNSAQNPGVSNLLGRSSNAMFLALAAAFANPATSIIFGTSSLIANLLSFELMLHLAAQEMKGWWVSLCALFNSEFSQRVWQSYGKTEALRQAVIVALKQIMPAQESGVNQLTVPGLPDAEVGGNATSTLPFASNPFVPGDAFNEAATALEERLAGSADRVKPGAIRRSLAVTAKLICLTIGGLGFWNFCSLGSLMMKKLIWTYSLGYLNPSMDSNLMQVIGPIFGALSLFNMMLMVVGIILPSAEKAVYSLPDPIKVIRSVCCRRAADGAGARLVSGTVPYQVRQEPYYRLSMLKISLLLTMVGFTCFLGGFPVLDQVVISTNGKGGSAMLSGLQAISSVLASAFMEWDGTKAMMLVSAMCCFRTAFSTQARTTVQALAIRRDGALPELFSTTLLGRSLARAAAGIAAAESALCCRPST